MNRFEILFSISFWIARLRGLAPHSLWEPSLRRYSFAVFDSLSEFPLSFKFSFKSCIWISIILNKSFLDKELNGMISSILFKNSGKKYFLISSNISLILSFLFSAGLSKPMEVGDIFFVPMLEVIIIIVLVKSIFRP